MPPSEFVEGLRFRSPNVPTGMAALGPLAFYSGLNPTLLYFLYLYSSSSVLIYFSRLVFQIAGECPRFADIRRTACGFCSNDWNLNIFCILTSGPSTCLSNQVFKNNLFILFDQTSTSSQVVSLSCSDLAWCSPRGKRFTQARYVDLGRNTDSTHLVCNNHVVEHTNVHESMLGNF